MTYPGYIGRFAPSPTGSLHFGSLVSALASFLDARKNAGKWLVRIEDLDPPREVPGATKAILRQLERHGLHWDGDILYQSHRHEAYQEAIHTLTELGLTYYCNCNRQRLKSLNGIYDGLCTGKNLTATDTALRLKVTCQNIPFDDLVVGTFTQNVSEEVGDFILKRRDGLFSYQLAVTVDDQHQGISHIIRGSDLLDSTPRQIYLQQCLNFNTPVYGHLPLALNTQGQKLSKQNQALELAPKKEAYNLWQALKWLNQAPPGKLNQSSVSEILDWAIPHWDLDAVPKQLTAPAPQGF